MVRSMLSGVSGLRAHQTRMDTIGNNIANVNTYGFKSGRTTFRDIYYQKMSSASEPTAASGGQNPSAVGYGTKVGNVDLMMGRSTFTMTDQTMDLAVDGDGFFQVQDGAGNIYYTRAGMLNFDSLGNLVDMQGNYVLGINGDPTGRGAGSERIRVSLSDVQPTAAHTTMTVNGRDITITASNPTTDGNLSFNFTTDSSLADGVMEAAISTSGIIIKMNPTNSYTSVNEFQNAVNDAIIRANDNQEHVAGRFSITVSGTDPFAEGALTAAEMVSTNYGVVSGSASLSGNTFFGGMTTTGKVGNTFSGTGAIGNITTTYDTASPASFTVSMVVGSQTYTGKIDESRTTSGKFNLYNANGDENDYIEISRPSYANLIDTWRNANSTPVNGSTVALDVAKVPAGFTAPVTAYSATYSDTLNGWTLSVTDNVGTHTAFAPDGYDGNTALTFSNGLSVAAMSDAAIRTAFRTYMYTQYPTNGQMEQVSFGGLTAKASAPSRALGLSSNAFVLAGGTEGGPQTIADMTGISIAPNGIITGWDSQGEEIIIGRIDIATFANASGLDQAGSSNYVETSNSGIPKITQPGSNGAGKLVGGTLELSNVDLSREFSDMITTQRGYQANSRIITVSDTMLEELINLKR
ncbi:MAG: flagellar hook-basal body complex protein [Ruminococcaceae bacterium]|nr:flagellar hook-basal body complex protein [Oscillospiraceae bacterium]